MIDMIWPAMLIATNNALVLWDDNREIVLHTGEGVYYGITWSHDRIFVVARGNQPSRMRVFDRTLYPLDDLPFEHLGPPGDGPHQAIWWDGVLYVTNTQANRVEMWHEATGEISHLSWEHGPEDGDVDHINSIWRDPAGGEFWIAEHRRELQPKRFRLLDSHLKNILTVELELGSLSAGSTHCGLHNVYGEDGYVYTLGPSQIVKFDLAGDVVEERSIDGVEPYRHYLRGLARSLQYFFIGVSKASTQPGRGWGASRIVALDSSLTKIDEFTLSERYGQIMEIRLIDMVDMAHNGIMCPLIAGGTW